MSQQYKYIAKFHANALQERMRRYTKDEIQVFASNSNMLSKFAPWLDANRTPDLISVSFEATVANEFNSNDHCVDAETAIDITYKYGHKQINANHNRDTIVGHVVSADMMERNFGKVLWQNIFF